MGLAGDDPLVDARTHAERPGDPRQSRDQHDLLRERLGPKPGQVVELRQRAGRDRLIAERVERRRHARLEQLRREREQRRHGRARGTPAAAATPPPSPRAQIRPGVEGPVRRRERAAENRRRAAARRHGLVWPTAKAGLAVTVVLGICGALGSVLGLPTPGLGAEGGHQTLAGSALFGLDPGTPTGLSPGYVFPLRGPHDFGAKIDRFGAPRPGHSHEGQDIFGKVGTPEVAVHDGVVIDRGKNTDPDSGGRGNFLAIYSPRDDRSFVYMHMLKPPAVLVGQRVRAGEVVGQLGCTGTCDGPHLHFEVRIGRASPGADTKPVDPLPYLRQWPQATP